MFYTRAYDISIHGLLTRIIVSGIKFSSMKRLQIQSESDWLPPYQSCPYYSGYILPDGPVKYSMQSPALGKTIDVISCIEFSKTKKN